MCKLMANDASDKHHLITFCKLTAGPSKWLSSFQSRAVFQIVSSDRRLSFVTFSTSYIGRRYKILMVL